MFYNGGGFEYMKSKKGNILIVAYAFGALIFYLLIFYMLSHGILKDVIPHSRHIYLNYEAFVNEAEPYIYPKKLPASAQEIRYYYYEGMLKDKSCYHVSLSREDFDALQQERLEYYSKYSDMQGGYLYNGSQKEYISLQYAQEQRIDFLDKIISIEEMNEYYFLCYYMHEGSDTYFFSGTLCNDETFELVEFSFYCPL